MNSRILCYLISFFLSNVMLAQSTDLTFAGQLSNVTLNCSNSDDPLVATYWANICDSSAIYSANLYFNGEFIATGGIDGDNPGVVCSENPTVIPPIIFIFEIDKHDLAPGDYFVEISTNLLGAIIDSDVTNTLTITNPFYQNIYMECGAPYDNSESNCEDVVEIYNYKPGIVLIVEKKLGRIIKVKNTGGTGYNMYAMNFDNLTNLPGYNYIFGYQQFKKSITAIDYTSDNKLLIGFSDGKILKINGLGGSGQNMFAINESSNGFSTVSGYNYYAGHHKFNSGITEIKNISDRTFVCLNSKKVLKVNGSGGTGANLFAIVENADGFTGLSGYNYYVGHHKFMGVTLNIYAHNGRTFFAFDNKKLLKIMGTGGSGINMFALTEDSNGFTGLSGYNYYNGHAKFQGLITEMEFHTQETTIGFDNGKLLKIAGIGGTGINMFAVNENSNGFTGVSGYNYYRGHAKYSSAISRIKSISNVTFVGFENGKMLKAQGTGGTGENMYNATEDNLGFHTSSTNYYPYLLGSSFFDTTPTDFDHFSNKDEILVAFSNKKIAKVKKTGGTGYNCFGTAQMPNGFAPLLGYNYVTGTQLLPCKLKKKSKQKITNNYSTPASKRLEQMDAISLYPNPSSNEVNISLVNQPLTDSSFKLDIINVSGQLMHTESQSMYKNSTINIDMSRFQSGVYFVRLKIEEQVLTKKLVKQE